MKQVGMVIVGAVVAATACGGSPPPAPPVGNVTPHSAEVHCKAAVEAAGGALRMRDREVTFAIGECEQQEWPQPLRACVAKVKTSDDLIACGTQLDHTRGFFAARRSATEAMREMEHFRDEMCGCKDMTCAQKVSDEMTKWSQDFAMENRGDAPKMSDDDVKRATEIGETMGKCMQHAMSGGGASQP